MGADWLSLWDRLALACCCCCGSSIRMRPSILGRPFVSLSGRSERRRARLSFICLARTRRPKQSLAQSGAPRREGRALVSFGPTGGSIMQRGKGNADSLCANPKGTRKVSWPRAAKPPAAIVLVSRANLDWIRSARCCCCCLGSGRTGGRPLRALDASEREGKLSTNYKTIHNNKEAKAGRRQ